MKNIKKRNGKFFRKIKGIPFSMGKFIFLKKKNRTIPMVK